MYSKRGCCDQAPEASIGPRVATSTRETGQPSAPHAATGQQQLLVADTPLPAPRGCHVSESPDTRCRTLRGRDALKAKAPQRRPRRRLGRRSEEVAKAVGGGYCRLQMPVSLALGVRETVAGHRLGVLEGGRAPPPPSNAFLLWGWYTWAPPHHSPFPVPASRAVVYLCAGATPSTTAPPSHITQFEPGTGLRHLLASHGPSRPPGPFLQLLADPPQRDKEVAPGGMSVMVLLGEEAEEEEDL